MTLRDKVFAADKVMTSIHAYQNFALNASIKIEQETGQSRLRFIEYWGRGEREGKWGQVFSKLVAQCELNNVNPYDYLKAQFAKWPVKTFNPRAKNPVPPFPTPTNLLSPKAWSRYHRWVAQRPDPVAKTDAYKVRQGQVYVERLMKVNPVKYPTVESVLSNPQVLEFLPRAYRSQLGL